ncbi:hypothetical protein ABTZ03_32860 [Kitasatospora sp. NPDC096077]|uniref:hypothetical protein n=1 Tax=Kitasatospora sp. NPDC096077 TaxID=3155544 RepID=UPI0033256E17
MRYWHGHGYGPGHGPGGWGLAVMAIVSLLVVVVLVLLAIALFRYISRSRRPIPHTPGAAGVAGAGLGGTHGWGHGPTPEQVLADRFARGEIDAAEYRHRLETLRSPGGGPGGDSSEPGGGPGGG